MTYFYSLGLTKAQEDKLYTMLDTSEFYTYINDLLNDFSIEHNHLWQVGFNGRSSGYLVLYQGFSRLSGYKSFCRECGQRNYKTVEETGNNRCGRCGADARINFETMPKEVGCYPGRSTDMGEDFEDWEAVVKVGNSLTDPFVPADLEGNDVWYTPMYTCGKLFQLMSMMNNKEVSDNGDEEIVSENSVEDRQEVEGKVSA